MHRVEVTTMSDQRAEPTPYLRVRGDHPLISVIVSEDGEDVTYYFTDEATADAVLSKRTIQEALSVIGAWSDLDWEEALEALDRIRHESKPTPPIDLDL
jgi:hypothetical protein